MAYRRRRCLVILPTFNERANLAQVVAGIRAAGHDVLVVDDGSPAGTGEVADHLARSGPGVHVIHQLGSPVVEVPIRFQDRYAGKSKVSRSEITKALALVPRLRWLNPSPARQDDDLATVGQDARPSSD